MDVVQYRRATDCMGEGSSKGSPNELLPGGMHGDAVLVQVSDPGGSLHQAT